MYFKIIFSILIVFCIVGCPAKPAKPLPRYKRLLLKHLSAMEKIKKAIITEMKRNPEVNDLEKIIDLINKRNNAKSSLLSNKIEEGRYFINRDIKIWKDFVLKDENKNTIVIYCKTNLYPTSSGHKYFGGALGGRWGPKYSPLKQPPF